jgi:hypothetical protein
VSSCEEIGLLFCDYFDSLFASSNPIFYDDLGSLLPPVISPEENLSLCAIPEEREISQAIYHLGLHKAPALMDLQASFIKLLANRPS